jgi:1,2-diacylglycerol 3-beta-galactosyltransferase
MKIIGLPVADKFCRPFGEKDEIRKQLGWPLDRPTVLMVGGGDGMGPLEMTAKAIDAAKLPLAMAIIAGRNQKLKAHLEQYHWQVPVKVYGFVQEMPDFMRASDILVTKAGPGTICEAFIAGLPIILYSRINGQEEGNVDYVVDYGAGVWAPRPDRVVDALDCWLKEPKERERAAQACLSLARPKAAQQIASLLMEQTRVPIR